MTLTMIGGRNPIPIINVFRFKDGKIVQIWNHRHDIDVGFAANILRVQGFAAGALSALLSRLVLGSGVGVGIAIILGRLAHDLGHRHPRLTRGR